MNRTGQDRDEQDRNGTGQYGNWTGQKQEQEQDRNRTGQGRTATGTAQDRT